jgi:hypothetical protein
MAVRYRHLRYPRNNYDRAVARRVSAARVFLLKLRLHCLSSSEANIQWECDNGGQLWPGNATTAAQTTLTGMPSTFCTSGFASLNTAFIGSLMVDLVCQVRDGSV